MSVECTGRTQGIAGPLKWHGGKHYLAKKIITMMPPHTHYVETHFGGGAVLLAKDPRHGETNGQGISEVANDYNGQLTNFWDVLGDDDLFKRFFRKIEVTPFSEVEYRRAEAAGRNTHPIINCDAKVDHAVMFFILCRFSLAGRMTSFAPLSKSRTRRGMNEQVSAWLTAVQGLPEVHKRMRQVVVRNRDAGDILRQEDSPGTLFYLDPPYMPETRSTLGEYGPYEMTPAEHMNLLHDLERVKGKFLLSGYPSPMYAAVAERAGWHRVEFDLPNNAASGATKARKTECVWANFPLQKPSA